MLLVYLVVFLGPVESMRALVTLGVTVRLIMVLVVDGQTGTFRGQVCTRLL